MGVQLGERQRAELVDRCRAIAVQLGPGSGCERRRAAEAALGKRYARQAVGPDGRVDLPTALSAFALRKTFP